MTRDEDEGAGHDVTGEGAPQDEKRTPEFEFESYVTHTLLLSGAQQRPMHGWRIDRPLRSVPSILHLILSY